MNSCTLDRIPPPIEPDDVSDRESGIFRILSNDLAPSEAQEETVFEVRKVVCVHQSEGLRQMSADYFAKFSTLCLCFCVLSGILYNEFVSELEARRPSRGRVARRSARKRKDFDPLNPLGSDPAFNHRPRYLIA